MEGANEFNALLNVTDDGEATANLLECLETYLGRPEVLACLHGPRPPDQACSALLYMLRVGGFAQAAVIANYCGAPWDILTERTHKGRTSAVLAVLEACGTEEDMLERLMWTYDNTDHETFVGMCNQDPEAKSGNILHAVAVQGWLHTLSWLKEEADPEALRGWTAEEDEYGALPVHLAALYSPPDQRTEAVQAWCGDHVALVDVIQHTNSEGRNLLHLAGTFNKRDIFDWAREVLGGEHFEALMQQADNGGSTPRDLLALSDPQTDTETE